MPAPAAATVPDTPTAVATQLFAALRAADTARLTALARFPFRLRDTGSEGECKCGSAQSAEQLPALIECLLTDTLLMEDLRGHPQLLIEEIARKQLPVWTKRWRKEIRADQALVHVVVPGNGNTFIVVTSAGGVHALWKDATFEGG